MVPHRSAVCDGSYQDKCQGRRLFACAYGSRAPGLAQLSRTGHEKWGPRKRLRCLALGTVGTASCLRVGYGVTREFGTSLPCNIVNGTDGD